TAGTDAIISALPDADPFRVELAIGFAVLVMLLNLRGAKESGTLFAFPTYGFVASIYIMLIAGFIDCAAGGCPQAESAGLPMEEHQALSVFLVIRAFAAGTTALTGVEAIADGTAAFRYPQSRNAATTLTIMGCLTISMFLGISWLADHTNVRYIEELENQRTVVAQIAFTVFDGGFFFYVIQAMTAAILVLAANTAYADFPRLSSILAHDRLMPRQFRNRGDRLVFSNGILVLTLLAAGLIYLFDANLTRLIQLYLIGVFISFTLSQSGLVRRFRRLKEPGWRRKTVISGFGAIVTGMVLMIIAVSKFTHGAWIIMASIPVLMYMMRSVYLHYNEVERILQAEERRPVERRPGHQNLVIVVQDVNTSTARAVGYVRSVPAATVKAVAFDPAVAAAWRRLAPEIELQVLRGSGSRSTLVRRFAQEKVAELGRDDFLTIIVPEMLRSSNVAEILWRWGNTRLKAGLLFVPGVQVMDIPLLTEDIDPDIDQAHAPGRNYAVILVSGVHNATLQAVEYAETLDPIDVRGVSFGLDPDETSRLGDRWLEAGIPHPLEIEDAPFRDIAGSLKRYLRQYRPDGVDRVVTVVIPEFVVSKKRHQILHGQTALIVKRHLLFEAGVVVVSVPYHLED
ncbi:MAG: amino acid permease, partial [Actinobacteria bacterium]|nr:amino acid permease [Actinomycetota bacterium]